MLRPLVTSLFLSTAMPLLADVPSVATDIAPVHGLVSRVMDGVGTPNLIIDPSASPHHYAMRPSEARALQNADIVFWVGEELTPWFHDRIEALASDARAVDLIHVEGTKLLDVREETIFEDAHDHDDDHADDHKDDHAHEDNHDDHGHEDDHDDHASEHKDEHDHGHEDDHGHSHEGTDPHAWLSPLNARVWTSHIASVLAKADPENAARYNSNAQSALTEITEQEQKIQELLASSRDTGFIVYHDAYQYLENGFGLSAAAALSSSDARDPGPAHLRALQDLIADRNVQCAFAEPQFDPQLLSTLLEGTEVRTGTLDPIGRDIALGPQFYPALLDQLGTAMATCLSN